MEKPQVVHDSQSADFRRPFGAVGGGEMIRLRLKIAPALEPAAVDVRWWRDVSGEEKTPMAPAGREAGMLVYEAAYEAPAVPGLLWYYFIIYRAGNRLYYGNNRENLGGCGQLYATEPPAYQITVHKAGAVTPNWFKDAVMYQIFPDRFCNGEPDGRVLSPKKNSVIQGCWTNTPFYIKDPATKKIMAWDFSGGNLRGIIAKLSYLKELGINVIYLNPVFESPSNHRYDTADYLHIDPMLGDNQLFATLCKKAGEMGIALILDGVFSHTGSDSIYFNREGNYPGPGAYQSPDSPYYSWYRFSGYPDQYESWWGIDTLPNVEELEPSYLNFIIEDEQSVLKHWLRYGVRGWRLDVADELPDEFIRRFRAALKAADPDNVLIGEVWEDASRKVSYGQLRGYWNGEELDSVMNYPFRNLLLNFIRGIIDAGETSRRLMSLYENYPRENFYALMNLLGSHDVPRTLTLLGEAPPADALPLAEQAAYRLGPAQRRLAVDRFKLLVLWQMTFPGVPCIYYGDEAGMEGYRDPFNRGPFPWGAEDGELLAWHRRLIALRRRHDVLRTGEWAPVYADGDVFGFIRWLVNGRDVFGRLGTDGVALVLINRSRDQARTISVKVEGWASGRLADILDREREYQVSGGRLTITLQALEGKLLVHEEKDFMPRGSGILLHPTCLPSKYGIGDLGKEAYEFINFLREAGQKYWQILPLNPAGWGESPYQCFSAFAGNPLLISLGKLVMQHLLTVDELRDSPKFDPDRVEYDKVKAYKLPLLKQAYARFTDQKEADDFREFKAENNFWLADYALFMALREHFGGAPWREWPAPVAGRDQAALDRYRVELAPAIGYQIFLQYTFFRQWQMLKRYANNWGISIIGDLPLFVAYDSCDVWAHRSLFELDEQGQPAAVAGVPPDYFSADGQLWGNPLYRWEVMADDDYRWWRDRIAVLKNLVDVIRLDHFRGFEAYWRVPAGERTAVNGRWVKGPGAEFFAVLNKYLGDLPFIAEDLGIITPEVEELRDRFSLPGMKVLQFSLARDWTGDCQPVVCRRNSVVYTGTHDNDTTVGWYKQLRTREPELAAGIARLLAVTDPGDEQEIGRRLVEFAYASHANTAIIPLPDILGLGGEARMNFPGTVGGNNWRWRGRKEVFTADLAARLAALTAKHGR